MTDDLSGGLYDNDGYEVGDRSLSVFQGYIYLFQKNNHYISPNPDNALLSVNLQVAFRAKVGQRYQLPHKGIIPEEFGVVCKFPCKNHSIYVGHLLHIEGSFIVVSPYDASPPSLFLYADYFSSL